MHTQINSTSFSRLWRENPPLALTSAAMAISIPIFLIALAVDPRMLGGQPLWMKPLKFAVSIALYCFTLQLILRFLQPAAANPTPREQRQARTIQRISWGIAFLFLIEVAAIFGQAARGRTSHFNNETPADSLIFGLMGAAVMGLFVLHLVLTWFVQRHRSNAIVLASGLRTGLLVSLLGMAVAYPMVTPTTANLEAFARGEQPTRIGAHSVGAPDGGPGLPVTGWSTEAGDLRVAHFVGMHAMQLIPLFAFWQLRRHGNRQSGRMSVRLAALGYAVLTIALFVQALRGQALLQPDGLTLASLGVAVAIFAAALLWPRPSLESMPTEREA